VICQSQQKTSLTGLKVILLKKWGRVGFDSVYWVRLELKKITAKVINLNIFGAELKTAA